MKTIYTDSDFHNIIDSIKHIPYNSCEEPILLKYIPRGYSLRIVRGYKVKCCILINPMKGMYVYVIDQWSKFDVLKSLLSGRENILLEGSDSIKCSSRLYKEFMMLQYKVVSLYKSQTFLNIRVRGYGRGVSGTIVAMLSLFIIRSRWSIIHAYSAFPIMLHPSIIKECGSWLSIYKMSGWSTLNIVKLWLKKFCA